MSFLTSFVSTTARNIHDGAIKTLAQWDPETVGETQITEWNEQAAEMAKVAVKAAAERDAAKNRVENLQNEVARYTAAAKKLAETNATAADKAADQALSYQDELASAKDELSDAESWATETRQAAESAQQKVAAGRQAIESAKREQARADQAKQVAEQRLKDREHIAGISTGLGGADAAIDALKANAAKSRQDAEAAKLRSGVLSKGADQDDAVKAALDEVDGKGKPQSLADKLARLG